MKMDAKNLQILTAAAMVFLVSGSVAVYADQTTTTTTTATNATSSTTTSSTSPTTTTATTGPPIRVDSRSGMVV